MKTITPILVIASLAIVFSVSAFGGLKKPCDNKKGLLKCDDQGRYICKNGKTLKAKKKCISKILIEKKGSKKIIRKIFIDY